MNVKRIASISLAAVISTNMYFTMYANTLKENKGVQNNIELIGNQDSTPINNGIVKFQHGINFNCLESLYDQDIELTEEQNEILKSLELMTYDLMQMFIEYDCIDENNNLIGLNHLENDELEEIQSYVTEIRIMKNKLINTVNQHEYRSKREYLLQVSDEYNLIENEQFNYDAYIDLPYEVKEKYKEQLKKY